MTDIQREVTLRRAWNRSLARDMRQCSPRSRAWIMQRIDENKAYISDNEAK